MSRWAARAKAAISKTDYLATVITDETPLTAVSSGLVRWSSENRAAISSVLSVGVPRVCKEERLLPDLLTAAMRVCDHFGDGEAARQQMRQECLETSPQLHADLLDHFCRTYGTAPRSA